MKNVFATTCILVSFWLTACSDSKGSSFPQPQASAFIDTLPGSAPYLTKDAKGNVVLSWIRELSDSAFVFCYAVSVDGGATFKTPIQVTPSTNIKPHAENLPKVIFKPSGAIIALWGTASTNAKNKYAGNVAYAFSIDDGKTWSEKQSLVKDKAGYDQRYFDVSLLSNGEVGIAWLDNRKSNNSEGSALYYATTTGTNEFSKEQRISESCCQCCRTDLYIDSKNNIHVLYRGILQDSIRDMVHIVSTNGGKTFSASKRISNDNWVLNACPHTGPAMTENTEGLHFAWYTGGQKKGTFYTRSTTNGDSFVQQDSISVAGKHPQLTATVDGKVALVWDEHVKVADGFNSRIGFQARTAAGTPLQKGFLTPDTTTATYPVIISTDKNMSLVAYCQKKNGKTYIAYQSIRL